MTTKKHYEELRQCLEAKGLFDDSLDPAVRTLAGLMERYDKAHAEVGRQLLITQTSREDNPRTILNPAAQLEIQLAEEIRKFMRDLGLVVAKPAGFVSQEKDSRPRNGDKLVSMMEQIEQPVKLYKKRG